MYDVDLFEAPIAAIKAKGAKVVCYFSAGSSEDWRPDYGAFSSAVLGAPLQGWPGERYLDIRSPAVRAVMAARLDLAKSKGCDGVEPDNVDAYSNANGLGLTAANQLEYNRWLAAAAHARGLSVALKNDLDQVAALEPVFDFAINEECFAYNECNMLQPFLSANKAVFNAEYKGSPCAKANAMNIDTILKNLSLDAKRTSCR